MEYNGIVSALPKQWRKDLKNEVDIDYKKEWTQWWNIIINTEKLAKKAYNAVRKEDQSIWKK